MRRKYTIAGENPTKYECIKRKCKWQGTDEDKYQKKLDDGYFEHVCPNCGNNEFYGLL